MAGTFDCAVCLDFALDDSSRDYFVTTECGHIFHHKCLKATYNRGPKVCPICRQKIYPNNWRKLWGIQAAEKQQPTRSKSLAVEKNDYDYKFKIILVGNSGVGKTSLAQRYVDESFRVNGVSTIGCDWFFKTIQVGNKRIYLSIWDTAGQERYHSVVTNYYRDAHGAMLVYDVTDPPSFEGIQLWETNVSMLAPRGIIKVLIGNKTDFEEQRKVSKETGKALAWKANMPFFETSAKDAVNVDIAFKTLAAKILETDSTIKTIETKRDNPNVKLNAFKHVSTECCC